MLFCFKKNRCVKCNFLKIALTHLGYFEIILFCSKSHQRIKMRVAVYNGRFSFPTVAHKSVIQFGIDHFDKLIIVIGSATTATNEKNPLTYEERASILGDMVQNMGFKYDRESNSFFTETKTVVIRPNSDYNEDEQWMYALTSIVHQEVFDPNDEIFIINPDKDSGNYWLKYFKDWGYESAPMMEDISASNIRSRFFHGNTNYVENAAYETVMFLEKWKLSDECRRIRAEFMFHEQIRNDEKARIEHNKTCKEKGLKPRYQTTYVTGDCAILQKRDGKLKILLITRKNIPGVGQIAIPGGYFEPGEDLSEYHTAIREAREEIGINLTDEQLNEFCVAKQIRFGDINRSLRGRILTMLQVFYVPEDVEITLTAQQEEVINLDWYAFDEVAQSECFEDHYYMIQRAFSEVIRYYRGEYCTKLALEARDGNQDAAEKLLNAMSSLIDMPVV